MERKQFSSAKKFASHQHRVLKLWELMGSPKIRVLSEKNRESRAELFKNCYRARETHQKG